MIPDPQFVTVLGDNDGHARWLACIDSDDVMSAYRQGGIYLLVTLTPDGEIYLSTKPGREWNCTWAPPLQAERA